MHQHLRLSEQAVIRYRVWLITLTVLSVILVGCREDTIKLYELDIRGDWDLPNIPEDNPLTYASIDLGRQFFYDKRLSVDSTVSCADCHKAAHGFADSSALSLGVKGRKGLRNSGTLTNVAYLPYFNRDGGVRTLDRFAIVPIEDHDEMGHNLVLLRQRLSQDTHYVRQAQQIYKRPPDGYVVSRALASFLRTFISDHSPFDRFIYDGDSSALTQEQLHGWDLFRGKGRCITCHHGQDLTNHAFENNGLYPSYANKDRGRQRVTDESKDEGKFRVATLRNIALTAPYMHDGSLADLRAVLDHYAGHGSPHPTKNPVIDSIQLTAEEQVLIIDFLASLTDRLFIENDFYLLR